MFWKVKFRVFKIYSTIPRYCTIFKFVYDFEFNEMATLNTHNDIAVGPNTVVNDMVKDNILYNRFNVAF